MQRQKLLLFLFISASVAQAKLLEGNFKVGFDWSIQIKVSSKHKQVQKA